MSGEAEHSDGRRTVGLFMPYVAAGKRIEAITFGPCTFGHLLRWQGGLILSSIALMVELSGNTLHEIESIRHPDDSRVMDAFLSHVHPSIAQDIREGVRPLGSADGAVYAPGVAPAAAQQGRAAPEEPAPAGASDPLGAYDGFSEVPAERPLDYVEGLDP